MPADGKWRWRHAIIDLCWKTRMEYIPQLMTFAGGLFFVDTELTSLRFPCKGQQQITGTGNKSANHTQWI